MNYKSNQAQATNRIGSQNQIKAELFDRVRGLEEEEVEMMWNCLMAGTKIQLAARKSVTTWLQSCTRDNYKEGFLFVL